MKVKRIALILLLLIVAFTIQAQQGINYKAIINDASGDILADSSVTIQFTILESGTTNVYQESHNYTTDANGILIANIGEGTPLSGDFNTIDWGSNSHFLKIEIDIGEGLTDMGTTEFKAVPYALFARDGTGAKELNDLEDAISDGSSIYIGQDAGIADDETVNENAAIGARALHSNTSGYRNVAIGADALFSNTTGYSNSAIGYGALYTNTEGFSNIACGYSALANNIDGSHNIATGDWTLHNNTEGSENTASGYRVLFNNTSGNGNTAEGYEALFNNISGGRNTAIGHNAQFRNTEGSYNTTIGYQALFNNATGDYNTALGTWALPSLTRGENNIAIGSWALIDQTSGNNNIGIGYDARLPSLTASNQVRIGNRDITYAGIQVAWTVTSDERWKEDIRNLPYGLDMLMKLKPVDYVRKNNEKETREMGIIAQDLEKVLNEIGYEDQGFLIKDDEGFMHLRYNDLIALLTRSIQDQQAIIEEQRKNIKIQYSIIEEQNSRIENQQMEIESVTYELGKNREEQRRLNIRLAEIDKILNTTQ